MAADEAATAALKTVPGSPADGAPQKEAPRPAKPFGKALVTIHHGTIDKANGDEKGNIHHIYQPGQLIPKDVAEQLIEGVHWQAVVLS